MRWETRSPSSIRAGISSLWPPAPAPHTIKLHVLAPVQQHVYGNNLPSHAIPTGWPRPLPRFCWFIWLNLRYVIADFFISCSFNQTAKFRSISCMCVRLLHFYVNLWLKSNFNNTNLFRYISMISDMYATCDLRRRFGLLIQTCFRSDTIIKIDLFSCWLKCMKPSWLNIPNTCNRLAKIWNIFYVIGWRRKK